MRVDVVNFRGAGLGAGSSLLSEWRVGAILQALALRDPRSGQLWLEIAGQRHAARIASGEQTGPRDGELLRVRVLRNSPVLALETLSSSIEAEPDADAISEALRRYVPRQESPALLLANLAWLMQGKSGVQNLPRAVLQAAAQLWQALPDAASLAEPEGLEKSIARSGAFLEAHLAAAGRGAAGAGPPAGDLKALLLSLSRALQEHGARASAARTDTLVHSPVPTAHGPLSALSSAPATFALVEGPTQQLNELARQTEGALARLTTTQIANTAVEICGHSILLEVPVRHEDRASMLRLRIEREGGRAASEGGDAWSVEAALDLGASGALHAKVTLAARRLGVQLRAESPAIVDKLAARAPELESTLREAGLEVDRIVCLHGLPAGDGGPRPARLLDVRA